MYKGFKNYIKKGIITLTLIGVIFSLFPYKIGEAKVQNRNYSTNTYINSSKLSKNISLSGVFDRYLWNFNIDEKTEIRSGELDLVFEVTDVLAPEVGSYLTFMLNGTEFYSVKIENNNGLPQSMKVTFPIELLKDGFNELRIEGYLRLTDIPCTDDYNTANWLVIREDSSLSLLKSNMISIDKISEFPYPFANEGGFSKTKVVIPQNYKDFELQNALKILGIIGDAGGSAEILKDIKDVDLASSNIIYIGRKSEIPRELEKTEIADFDGNASAFLGMYPSPLGTTGEEKILYVFSDNEEQLNAGLSFLMNKELPSQISSNTTLINSKMDLFSKISKNKKTYTFKELGYFQRPVEGLFRRSTSIIYNLPNNKRLGVGDIINIDFRYSENLDFERSLFTVFINDNPVGSKRLEKDKANRDNLVVHIPEDAVNSPSMEIKFVFDLNLDDVNCEINDQAQPWALVLDNSTIQVNERNIGTYFFDSYPAPFISDWNYNNVLFVLPENLKNEDLTALGDMVSFMGKGVKYNLGNLSVVNYKDFNNNHKKSNIILYGTPENNPLIKEQNKNMWLKYSKDFTHFTSNEKINIMRDYGERISSFQLDVSPYDSSKYILYLTSPKEELLREATKYLSDEKLFYKLSGDGVIIDENGNVKNFTYKEMKESLSYEKLKSLDTNSAIILALIGLMLLFALVSVILYVVKNNRYKKNKKKMKH